MTYFFSAVCMKVERSPCYYFILTVLLSFVATACGKANHSFSPAVHPIRPLSETPVQISSTPPPEHSSDSAATPLERISHGDLPTADEKPHSTALAGNDNSWYSQCSYYGGGIGNIFACGKQLCQKKAHEENSDNDPAHWCSIPAFKVYEGRLYDSNGQMFVIRGVNHAFAWYGSQASTALGSIATLGFNTVRMVWETGKDVQNFRRAIDEILNRHMIPIVEFHDATGSGRVEDLLRLVRAWTDESSYAGVLRGLEDKVIINIANEWGGNIVSKDTWFEAYKTAISRMREAGLNHVLLIDSIGWGQDPAAVIERGSELYASDPLGNVMFSIHAYEKWRKQRVDKFEIAPFLAEAAKRNIAVIIGEFAYKHDFYPTNMSRPLCVTPKNEDAQHLLIKEAYGTDRELSGEEFDIDFRELMSQAHHFGVGYIAWSYKGNTTSGDPNSDCRLEYLDLAKEWDIGSGAEIDLNGLSGWGCEFVKQLESVPATIFSKTSSWRITNHGVVCSNMGNYPSCEAFRGGYGEQFACLNGFYCRRRNEQWANSSPANWCILTH